MTDSNSYKNIFKTTFLFGFVQIFNILVKVGLNKVVALLLGPSGVGIIGMFNSTMQTITNFAGLGINQSAVRDISEANGTENPEKSHEIISLVSRVVIITGVFGMVIMILGARWLSWYTFDSGAYATSYAFLSIAVCAQIMTAGQTAILTGMRRLRQLARCSMIAAVVGLITGIPFYFLFREKGIVPSLLVSNCSMFLVSWFYVKKIPYAKVTFGIKQIWFKSRYMVKMGIALMTQGLIIHLCNLIIASYINRHGGLSVLGYYQAGITIITSYFGIILTSMSTEYYPRISAMNTDNVALKEAVNAQCEMGMIIALPLIVIFVFLSKYFLTFLYSLEFSAGTQYVDWAVLGTYTVISSNCMGMVLLAKQKSKLFLTSSLLMNIVVLTVNLLSYRQWNLLGLGFGYFFSALLQFIVYDIMMTRYYNISFSKTVLALWGGSIAIIIMMNLFKICFDGITNYVCSGCLILFSILFSVYYLKLRLDIDISKFILSKIKR